MQNTHFEESELQWASNKRKLGIITSGTCFVELNNYRFNSYDPTNTKIRNMMLSTLHTSIDKAIEAHMGELKKDLKEISSYQGKNLLKATVNVSLPPIIHPDVLCDIEAYINSKHSYYNNIKINFFFQRPYYQMESRNRRANNSYATFFSGLQNFKDMDSAEKETNRLQYPREKERFKSTLKPNEVAITKDMPSKTANEKLLTPLNQGLSDASSSDESISPKSTHLNKNKVKNSGPMQFFRIPKRNTELKGEKVSLNKSSDEASSSHESVSPKCNDQTKNKVKNPSPTRLFKMPKIESNSEKENLRPPKKISLIK